MFIPQTWKNWLKYANDAAAIGKTVITGSQLAFLSQGPPIKPCLWFRDKHTCRCEILSRPGECMNYSLNRETLVCLMALVMVTKGDWQPARTHKQKHDDLGQDGASPAGYIMLSMIMERYAFLQSLCKLCFRGSRRDWLTGQIFCICFHQWCLDSNSSEWTLEKTFSWTI